MNKRSEQFFRRLCQPDIAVGGLRLPSYTVLLYIGCVAGVFAGVLAGAAWGGSADRIAASALVLIAVALAGSRLLYIVTHVAQFRREPARLWRRLDGGGALYGGLILAVAASPAVLAITGVGFLEFWDAASVIMLVGIAITKVGCLMRGCCAGRPTESGVAILLPDHRGVWLSRVPSQLLESGSAIAILVISVAMHSIWPVRGAVFAAALICYGAARIPLELTRLPDGSRWSRTVNLAISLSLVVCGAVLAISLGHG
ncbi:prolipoprotein diacylglyceryl transferase [Mycobacterium sp. Y57]|uniref:prolipoprotein diacylglyceryl transferase n=1 Tax=Mycolicibacterium xanthum TaxID=2796469 RepID=UPI001C84F9FF|nr:prolipoprotein diacylglyceryl transferase family protein [Mycolicibacterium xanthum]MBX7435411.1 prolipoprotein diacylglyceryl transferase [Mycolicibacterium xanthum]